MTLTGHSDASSPQFLPALMRMADGSRGRFLLSDLQEAVRDGRMQLWSVRDADVLRCVFLTEIIAYPRARALRFVACVGSGWRQWRGLQQTVRAWAHEKHGCVLCEALAPAKWGPVFPDLTVSHVLMEGAI